MPAVRGSLGSVRNSKRSEYFATHAIVTVILNNMARRQWKVLALVLGGRSRETSGVDDSNEGPRDALLILLVRRRSHTMTCKIPSVVAKAHWL